MLIIFLVVVLSEIFGPGFDARATSLYCPVVNVSDAPIVSAPTAIVHCTDVRRAKSSQSGLCELCAVFYYYA